MDIKTVNKPWGYYIVLHEEPGCLIKKIVVKPHEALSLQKHMFREEIWTVIKGPITVTLEEDVRLLETGEYVKIEKEALHRLENFSDKDVGIIEVSIGDKIDEDDIIRIMDKYNRV